MKSYYELLEVAPTASADEIKRSFRREIAKYHPDKVQHLGTEFQEIAAVKAAELTQAYKTLTDDTLRADYNALLESGEPAPVRHAPPPPPPPADAPSERPGAAARPAPERGPSTEPQGQAGSSVFSQERAGASDLVRRATVMRFRQALIGEFGEYEESAVQGFEIGCLPKPSFWKMKAPPRVLARFVPHVDAAALTDAWGMASKLTNKKDQQRDVCVFVMGPMVAPAGALATAISEQRRKPTVGGKLFMVPVNTHTWAAHVPNDAPPVIKSLLARLKSAV